MQMHSQGAAPSPVDPTLANQSLHFHSNNNLYHPNLYASNWSTNPLGSLAFSPGANGAANLGF